MNKEYITKQMEQFENFFDWADQIKDSEIARWEIMYGCTPDRLLKEIKTALTQLEKTVREEDVELLAEYFYHQILYDIDGKKPAWVIRGNSLKQQEARKKASKTLNPTK